MDRKRMLALIAWRPRFGAVSPASVMPEARGPEAVYLAARAIRIRIDAALEASRQPPVKRVQR